ncbi:MAG: DUF4412 domain-containing protein [Myxococcus sp.]|nr:DUF4412 domain-containing protein [Myxococcus sp.]
MMALVLAVVVAAPAVKAAAPFEGVLEYRLALQGGSGAVTTSVSGLGVHTTATVKYLDQVTNTAIVVRARDAEASWVWQAGEKRYTKVPVAASPKRALKAEAKGSAVVATVPCVVVVVTGPDGVSEYCSAVGFVGDATRELLLASAQRLAPDVEAALRSVNGYGLVVRLKQTSPDGKVLTGFELVSVKRRPIDKALFDVERVR